VTKITISSGCILVAKYTGYFPYFGQYCVFALERGKLTSVQCVSMEITFKTQENGALGK
jgi:hypothetical protein